MSLSSNTVTSINVAWEPVPCMHRNGDITGYAVMYRELSSGLATYIHETVATRNINITGLKPSTLYEIAVAAFNSVGTGPFTNASLKTDTLDTTGPLPSVTATPNVPTASGDEKTSSNDTAGTVAGVVVSLLVIIGATIGIIVAVLWIRRRYMHIQFVLLQLISHTACHVGGNQKRVSFQQATLMLYRNDFLQDEV